ncbi:class I adenylate-forming enzyme family protein [Spirosoma pollinicola]|uniref:AMP-dependent synthetase/ligase domain-containing protein n=1 Tax=Spirosoma pollinicola TaxID=2057025 RepID=A0A2K8Z3I5_9BACT|nr:class I adenylate-forming enzyme family protein [Spirosoma pollinicola]AUD04433.1 hypothetical protein CWM47_22855 [Spirosoma pollinicola]
MASSLTTLPQSVRSKPALLSPPDRLAELLRYRNQLHPEDTAFIEHNQSVSYAELWQRVDQVQASFRRQQIGPGEVVALCSPNSLALCVAFLAALQHGAVPFVINYKLDVLGDLSALNVRHFLVSKSNSAARRYFKELPYFDQNAFNEQFDCYQNPYASLDPLTNTALLVTSSGSSGQAKVVQLTHHGTLANIQANVRALQLCSDDVTAIGLPIGYAYGLVGQLLSHLYVGATVLLLDSLFFLPSLTQAVSKYKVTNLFTVPPMIRQVNYLRSQNQFKGDFSSLRFVAVGGNRIESTSVKKAMELFGCPIIKTYGLAEAGPRVATNLITDLEAVTVESVGKPNDGVHIDVLDSAGQLVSPYQPGTICIRSPSVTLGYFNAPNRDTIRPGQAVITRDIGFVDEEGHLFILGRQGDQFVIGSRQYWFREVEGVLYARFAFLKISLQSIDDQVIVSVVAMRNYEVDLPSVQQHLRTVFGPEADTTFTLKLIQSNTLLNEK